MRLTLVDHGYPFKKIMQGRKWIGRVAKMGDGSGFLGIIGKLECKASTEVQAFEEVGAQYMGHSNAQALRNQNARVRVAKRVLRRAGDHVAGEMLRGNYKPFDKIMTAPAPVADALMGPVFRSVSRRLFKK